MLLMQGCDQYMMAVRRRLKSLPAVRSCHVVKRPAVVSDVPDGNAAVCGAG